MNKFSLHQEVITPNNGPVGVITASKICGKRLMYRVDIPEDKWITVEYTDIDSWEGWFFEEELREYVKK